MATSSGASSAARYPPRLPLLIILIGLTFLGVLVTGATFKVLFDWHSLAVVVDPVDVLVYQAE